MSDYDFKPLGEVDNIDEIHENSTLLLVDENGDVKRVNIDNFKQKQKKELMWEITEEDFITRVPVFETETVTLEAYSDNQYAYIIDYEPMAPEIGDVYIISINNGNEVKVTCTEDSVLYYGDENIRLLIESENGQGGLFVSNKAFDIPPTIYLVKLERNEIIEVLTDVDFCDYEIECCLRQLPDESKGYVEERSFGKHKFLAKSKISSDSFYMYATLDSYMASSNFEAYVEFNFFKNLNPDFKVSDLTGIFITNNFPHMYDENAPVIQVEYIRIYKIL